LRVDDDYPRNASCALHLISTFLFEFRCERENREMLLVKCEMKFIKTKRNLPKRNETNETKRNVTERNKMKRNLSKRNETKRNYTISDIGQNGLSMQSFDFESR
jgi:hypothetical protein